jgi:ATP-binding cassette subfamily F protein 3
MTPAGIEEYSGNYSSYLLQRQDRWEFYERVFEEEKARLVKEVDFIQRNWVRASTHARALGLLKRVSRDISIVETYGIMALRSGKKWSETGLHADRPLDVIEAIRKVNAIQLGSSRPPRIRPRLTAADVSGNMVLHAQKVVIGYPDHPLFTIPEVELRRGECTALIGPNGCGKTTFLKVLLNQLEPLQGEVRLGSSLKVGYFAQAHDNLNPRHTVLEELLSHKEMGAEQARSHLAQYLFRGEDVFKPISALSGGERARLVLAVLSLKGSNFLLLDEPTNHLDIPAREALQEVLDNFTGTILLVSHDRYLIDQLATQIWDIRDGKLHIFKGSYRDYLLRRAIAAPTAAARLTLLPSKPLLKVDSREAKRKAETLAQLEERIREQESTIQRLSSELQRAGEKQTFERMQNLSWQIAQSQARLETLMGEWEKLAV